MRFAGICLQSRLRHLTREQAAALRNLPGAVTKIQKNHWIMKTIFGVDLSEWLAENSEPKNLCATGTDHALCTAEASS